MEGLNFTPLLIGLGALFLGWGMGFIDSNNRSAKKIRQAETNASNAVKQAKDRSAELEARIASLSPGSAVANGAGLLRLQDEAGRLQLDMDGVRVDTAALSPDQKKRLIALLTLMRPWLEGGAPAQVSPASTRAAGQAGVPAGAAPARPAVAGRPEVPPAPDEEKPLAPPSMVSQIDSILQVRLTNTALAGRGIRLQESPEGGVIVYVGLNKYPTVDDVPDAGIKTTIRAAIAEWEERFTPGI